MTTPSTAACTRAAGMAHGDAIEVEIAAQRARDDFRIESIGIGAGKAVQSFQNIGRAGKALADQERGSHAVLCGACRIWMRFTVEPD